MEATLPTHHRSDPFNNTVGGTLSTTPWEGTFQQHNGSDPFNTMGGTLLLIASVNDQERFVKVAAAEGQVVKVSRGGATSPSCEPHGQLSLPPSTASDHPTGTNYHSYRLCQVSRLRCGSLDLRQCVRDAPLCSFGKRFYPTKDVECFNWHLIEMLSDRTSVL